MKFKEKQQALSLRRKGYSLREISELLSVSKGTVSLWCNNIALSKEARVRLQKLYTRGQLSSQRVLRQRTKERLQDAKEKADLVLNSVVMSNSYGKVLCAMLHWCEGSKSLSDGELQFVNSDPKLVSLFLKLLRGNFEIDETKLRVSVQLHAYHDIKKQLRFWAKITNIPVSSFIKPYIKSNHGPRTRDNYQGCVSIRYYDVIVSREVQAIARETMSRYGPIV